MYFLYRFLTSTGTWVYNLTYLIVALSFPKQLWHLSQVLTHSSLLSLATMVPLNPMHNIEHILTCPWHLSLWRQQLRSWLLLLDLLHLQVVILSDKFSSCTVPWFISFNLGSFSIVPRIPVKQCQSGLWLSTLLAYTLVNIYFVGGTCYIHIR